MTPSRKAARLLFLEVQADANCNCRMVVPLSRAVILPLLPPWQSIQPLAPLFWLKA